MTYLPLVVGGVVVLALVVTVLRCRSYVAEAFDSVDEVLDSVLARDHSVRSRDIADDRISKLTHKAGRIMAMYVADAAEAEREKATVQAFISDLSHQMKTPLSSIAMYSDLLGDEELSPADQREFVTRIAAGTEKLRWMVDSLITVSRLEVGAIQPSPSRTGIRQTIADAIGGVVSIAAQKDISIVVAPFDDVSPNHDSRWTREVLGNILENAVKYSHPHTSVEVSVEQLSFYTRVTVTDHGIGIPEDDRYRVFARFYRGRNATDTDGSGLGLYLAALVMQKQGGYVVLDSGPHDPTAFSVFLRNCED